MFASSPQQPNQGSRLSVADTNQLIVGLIASGGRVAWRPGDFCFVPGVNGVILNACIQTVSADGAHVTVLYHDDDTDTDQVLPEVPAASLVVPPSAPTTMSALTKQQLFDWLLDRGRPFASLAAHLYDAGVTGAVLAATPAAELGDLGVPKTLLPTLRQLAREVRAREALAHHMTTLQRQQQPPSHPPGHHSDDHDGSDHDDELRRQLLAQEALIHEQRERLADAEVALAHARRQSAATAAANHSSGGHHHHHHHQQQHHQQHHQQQQQQHHHHDHHHHHHLGLPRSPTQRSITPTQSPRASPKTTPKGSPHTSPGGSPAATRQRRAQPRPSGDAGHPPVPHQLPPQPRLSAADPMAARRQSAAAAAMAMGAMMMGPPAGHAGAMASDATSSAGARRRSTAVEAMRRLSSVHGDPAVAAALMQQQQRRRSGVGVDGGVQGPALRVSPQQFGMLATDAGRGPAAAAAAQRHRQYRLEHGVVLTQDLNQSDAIAEKAPAVDVLAQKVSLPLLPYTQARLEYRVDLCRAQHAVLAKQAAIAGPFTQLGLALKRWARRGWSLLAENVLDWRPWEETVRVIGMRFGAGLAGYFEFSRWLFLLNFVLFVLWFFFLVVPQRAVPDDPANAALVTTWPEPLDTGGARFLAATGSWGDSLLFYGHYRSSTGRATGDPAYNFPLAHFLCTLASLVGTVAAVGLAVARSVARQTSVTAAPLAFPFGVRVLTAWDHRLANADTMMTARHTFGADTRALLVDAVNADMRAIAALTSRTPTGHVVLAQRAARARFAARVGVWCIVVAAIAGLSYFLTWVGDNNSFDSDKTFASPLAMPLAFVLINHVAPLIFSYISNWESWAPDRRLAVTFWRTLLLHVVIGATYWRVVTASPQMDDSDPTRCWETRLGQEAYRLLMFDFFASIIMLLLKVFAVPLVYIMRGNDDGIVYDVPVNAAHLLLRQLLVLVALPVFPLAPAMALLISLVLTNCVAALLLGILPASRRPLPFGAGPVFYKRVLLAALVFAVVPTAYFAAGRTPGPCGPYRGREHMFQVVAEVVDTLPAWIRGICYFVASAGFAVPCIMVLVGLIVWLAVRAAAHERAIVFLRRWAATEREGTQRIRARRAALAQRRQSFETASDHSQRPQWIQ